MLHGGWRAAGPSCAGGLTQNDIEPPKGHAAEDWQRCYNDGAYGSAIRDRTVCDASLKCFADRDATHAEVVANGADDPDCGWKGYCFNDLGKLRRASSCDCAHLPPGDPYHCLPAGGEADEEFAAEPRTPGQCRSYCSSVGCGHVAECVGECLEGNLNVRCGDGTEVLAAEDAPPDAATLIARATGDIDDAGACLSDSQCSRQTAAESLAGAKSALTDLAKLIGDDADGDTAPCPAPDGGDGTMLLAEPDDAPPGQSDVPNKGRVPCSNTPSCHHKCAKGGPYGGDGVEPNSGYAHCKKECYDHWVTFFHTLPDWVYVGECFQEHGGEDGCTAWWSGEWVRRTYGQQVHDDIAAGKWDTDDEDNPFSFADDDGFVGWAIHTCRGNCAIGCCDVGTLCCEGDAYLGYCRQNNWDGAARGSGRGLQPGGDGP